MIASQLPDWLTREEAASYMRMSTHTLAGWAYKQGPPFRKFGNRAMYRKADVVEWMEAA